MMWPIVLWLVSTLNVQAVNTIYIERKNEKEVKSRPKVDIVVDTVKELAVTAAERCKFKVEGNRIYFELEQGGILILIIPNELDSVIITKGDYDLHVVGSSPYRGDWFSVTKASGYFLFSGEPFKRLVLSNISGKIVLDWKPKLEVNPKVRINNVAGKVEANLVPGKFSISNIAGLVKIKETTPIFDDSLYNYTISNVAGKVEVPEYATRLIKKRKIASKEKPKDSREKDDVIQLFRFEFHDNKQFGIELPAHRIEMLDATPSGISYNRVEGLYLFPIITTADSTKGVLQMGAGYGTASPNFHYYLSGEKLVRFKKAKLGLGLSLYKYTATSDLWKVERDENSCQALLLKEDLMDFYGNKGFEIFSTLRLTGWISKLSYVQEERSSVKKGTDFSVFYSDKSFRENPSLVDGFYRLFRWEISKPQKFYTRAEYYLDTPSGEGVYKLFGSLDAKSKIKPFKLQHRITFGYSSKAEFPYGFSLGGPTTLPGYGVNTINTDKFIVAHEYLKFPIKSLDLIAGVYAGFDGNNFYGDFLGGVKFFDGLSLFVTRDRESDGIRYYLRFDTRI